MPLDGDPGVGADGDLPRVLVLGDLRRRRGDGVLRCEGRGTTSGREECEANYGAPVCGRGGRKALAAGGSNLAGVSLLVRVQPAEPWIAICLQLAKLGWRHGHLPPLVALVALKKGSRVAGGGCKLKAITSGQAKQKVKH